MAEEVMETAVRVLTACGEEQRAQVAMLVYVAVEGGCGDAHDVIDSILRIRALHHIPIHPSIRHPQTLHDKQDDKQDVQDVQDVHDDQDDQDDQDKKEEEDQDEE